MVIFPLAHDQTIAQMWSNGVQGGGETLNSYCILEQQAECGPPDVAKKVV